MAGIVITTIHSTRTRGTLNEIYTDKMKHNENVKSHEKSHITKSF